MPWIMLPGGGRSHVKLGGRKTRVAPSCAARIGTERCGCVGGYLCDHPINDKGDTCDMPLCEAHAHVIGPDRHCCPKHYKPQKVA